MNKVLLVFLTLIYFPVIFAQQTAQSSPIGYATVEEAFEALQQDERAVMSSYEGWTLFKQKIESVYVLWSFTPDYHPTHPTVIRREIVKRGDEISIKMDALCYSSKFDCDQLIEEFKRINERIKQNLTNG